MNKEKGVSYILVSVLSFIVLCIEFILAYLIEPIVYNKTMHEWSDSQYITHWTLTCIIWGIGISLIYSYSKNKLDFNFLKRGPRMNRKGYILIIIAVIVSFCVSYYEWNGIKIIIEYTNLGFIKFIYQYIYYACEVMLFMLILIFGQKACEIWFKKKEIPYGGVIVAVSWGASHFLSKDIITGIFSMLAGFIFGSVYLLTNRDGRKTYNIFFLIFIL